jgi:hypothetical protein
MSYETVGRELEAMDELMEDTHDPDYGWLDIWQDEAAALEYENREQELAQEILDDEIRMAIWTIK